MAIMLLSLIAGMSLAWVLNLQRDQRRSIETIGRREAQLRSLTLIGEWIGQASRIRAGYGSVRTDAHTLILEIPNTDSLGYRTDASDIVTLRWVESDRLDVAILTASGSLRSPKFFSLPGKPGEVHFQYLDERGLDATYDPERAKGVQVRFSKGPKSLFTLGSSGSKDRNIR